MEKAIKTWKILKIFLYVTISVLILIFAEKLIGNGEDGYAHFVVGGIMLVYGIEEIARHLVLKKSFFEDSCLYWGVIDLLLGLLLVLKVRTPQTVYVTWAIWSILRETEEIREVVELFQERIYAFVNLTESILILVFSVMLIINPTPHHALTHIYLLIMELCVNSISPFVYYIIKKKREEKE